MPTRWMAAARCTAGKEASPCLLDANFAGDFQQTGTYSDRR